MLNAITVDVEDYFHTEAMSQSVARSDWEAMPSRVEANTRRLFDLFDRYDVKATFFFLGWVAERFPGLVAEAHQRGHELGCHSYWHRAVFRLTPEEFREDTHRARCAIEDASGAPVRGYRAPSFSITPNIGWAFEVLAELGFEYDSSVNPVRHDFYANPDGPRTPHAIANGALLELPVATWRVGSHNLPVGGGAYLRIFPYAYIRHGIRAMNEHERKPAMLYLHPWEIDDEQPRLPARLKSRLRQYTNLSRMERKLERLIQDFKVGPVGEAFQNDIEPFRRRRLASAASL